MKKTRNCISLLLILTLLLSFIPNGLISGSKVNAMVDIDVTILNNQYPITTKALYLNKAVIKDFELFSEDLSQLPFLERVELCGSNLDNEHMEILQNMYPDVKFVWNIRLGNFWTIRTDQVAFSCNKGPGPELYNADVEQLKYCTDMVALDLGHNAITDVSFVKYMPNLRVLILSDNHTLTDISPVATCKNLVYFEAWVCKIKDLSPLQYLVNLLDINMCYNKCSDITPLLKLPRLERIYMSHCGLSGNSIKQLRSTFPNATIEMSIAYTWDGGWRTVPRFYAMRNMYKTNTVSDLFLNDYDRLGYFSKVFNADFYSAKYPEIVEKVGNDPIDLLYHFLNYGIHEGQQGCESFNVVDFVADHQELIDTLGSDPGNWMRYYLYEYETV